MSNSAPYAPTLNSPVGSIVIDYAFIQRFSWTFLDPDVGDSQSAFDLQYRIVGAGGWTQLNGTTPSGATPNNFVDLPAGTLASHNYEWQVRTYDALGVVGPWSASSFFTASTAPADPAITAPISGATVNAAPTLTWSAPSQTDYQVRRVRDLAGVADTSTIYYDSGDVIDAVTRSVVLSMPINNRYEHLQVRIKAAGVWSNWVSVRVLDSYTLPSPGSVTVVADPVANSLQITTAPAPVGGGEPTPISIDLYIREVGEAGFGTRVKADLFPTSLWIWFAPASGKSYEVRSLTTGDNGAQRWSTLTFTHVIDGGAAVAGVWAYILDGGNASTVFTHIIDGGAP